MRKGAILCWSVALFLLEAVGLDSELRRSEFGVNRVLKSLNLRCPAVSEDQRQHPLEARELFEIQPAQRRFRQAKQESSEILLVAMLKLLPAMINSSEEIPSYRG